MSRKTLNLGEYGEDVRELNSILQALEYSVRESTNEFDQRTRDAILAFQNDNGIEITGAVDEKTWRVLDNIYTKRFGYKAKSKIVEETKPSIEVASISEKVELKELQEEPESKPEPEIIKLEAVDTEVLNEMEDFNSRAASRPTLRQGSTGKYVIDLQNYLIALNFLRGTPDGIFGSVTASAVRNFQKQNNLNPDGVVGQNTWAAIDRAIAKQRPTLRQGSTGSYVIELQDALKRLGYFTGSSDGVFGSQTAAAVRAFQGASGIPADGVVGDKTWNAIDEALRRLGETPSGARPVLREGSTGVSVGELQLKLKILGYYTGEVDGDFGSKTTAAVREFQRSRKLVDDGVVGPATWEALNRAAAATPQPPVNINRPTVREGDRGENVVFLQEALQAIGYFKGDADGIFGPKTTEAVKKFQKDANLVADGVVGASTWQAIDRVLSNPVNIRPTLKEGATGSSVTILQEKLKFVGFFSGSVTGSFGPETTTAVKNYQRANGLPADGVVGSKTWALLYDQTATGTIPSPSPDGRKPTLKYGDTGEYVIEVQNELTALLYYDGPISGKFDWGTQVAVKAFQDANRLTPDGVVGRSTWNALTAFFPPPVICV